MSTKIKSIPATQGWEQFLNNKIEMLYLFEVAKKFSKSHKVQVTHGHSAEALFRKWLSDFLPEKYGVSSGYIVSQNKAFWGKTSLPHYDVIIYDKLNSPILWIEENYDKSNQGKVRAFPAEYVKAVIEVKSSMTLTTVKKMIKKLHELDCLISEVNEIGSNVGKIPRTFFSASVFFELKNDNAIKQRKSIIDEYKKTRTIHNYYGSCILCAEKGRIENTGLIKKMIINNELKEKLRSGNKLSTLYDGNWYYDDIEDQNISYLFTWQKFNFAMFAFDLIALLESKYNQNRISSLYGFTFEDFEEF